MLRTEVTPAPGRGLWKTNSAAGVAGGFLQEAIRVLGHAGDANFDGVVDLQDLNLVRNNFGNAGLGDTDGDNDIDLADLNAVRNNFGAKIPFSAAAVPEPSAFVLALLLGVGLACARR